MAEPRSLPIVTSGHEKWDQGKRNRPCVHPYCQNRFHLLELGKESVKNLKYTSAGCFPVLVGTVSVLRHC